MITYNDPITSYILPVNTYPTNDGKITVNNLLPSTKKLKNQFPVEELLLNKFKLQSMSIEFTKNIGIDSDSHYSYERYLQADNSAIKSVAKTIILQSKAKTNDEKMYAIEQWVTKNIQYKSDQENYKTSEYKSHSAPIRK